MEIDVSGMKKKLLCIEYPGIVKNNENMLKTLGGITEISRMIASRNRRLELRFRPDDPFCKPACGDRCVTNSLLLKVKVRVKKNSSNNVAEEEPGKICSAEIVARITTSIKFKSLCDFQYLPMTVKEDGTPSSLVPSFLPHTLVDDNLLKWFEEPSEYFLPPPAFARVDTLGVNSYMYRKGVGNDKPAHVIGRTRKRRAGYGYFVSNDVKGVPTKPREKALAMVKIKMCETQLQQAQKLFNDRPVWSKLALACVSKISWDLLKVILPAVAYYFVTGPFRVMWVRLGYDPRIVPESKIYQTLDYRVRFFDGLNEKVRLKRGYANWVVSTKTSSYVKKCITLSKKDLENPGPRVPDFKGDEYLFTPVHIPHSRQMFYQYVDLKVPEIEEMFERLPKINEEYDPKRGWLPRGFDNHCRDIISTYLMGTLKKTGDQNIEEWKADEIDDSTDEEEKWLKEDVSDADIDDSDIE